MAARGDRRAESRWGLWEKGEKKKKRRRWERHFFRGESFDRRRSWRGFWELGRETQAGGVSFLREDTEAREQERTWRAVERILVEGHRDNRETSICRRVWGESLAYFDSYSSHLLLVSVCFTLLISLGWIIYWISLLSLWFGLGLMRLYFSSIFVTLAWDPLTGKDQLRTH